VADCGSTASSSWPESETHMTGDPFFSVTAVAVSEGIEQKISFTRAEKHGILRPFLLSLVVVNPRESSHTGGSQIAGR
jgi:hypothetical protein